MFSTVRDRGWVLDRPQPSCGRRSIWEAQLGGRLAANRLAALTHANPAGVSRDPEAARFPVGHIQC